MFGIFTAHGATVFSNQSSERPMSSDERIHRVATEITKELTDSGKLIEAGFAAFRHLCISKNAPQLQIDEMRLAWMAGAEFLFSSIMVMLDPGTEPTEKDEQRLELIHRELEAWKAKFAERAMPSKGSA